MESAADPRELDRARRAFMGRIARIVLPDGDGIDRRDAMALIDCDVIQSKATREEEGSVEQFQKGGSIENGSSLGPLYFYPSQSGGTSVSRARDLLLDHRRGVRDVALGHLVRTAASGHLMCERTQEALARLRPAVTSDDWRRAAVELVDALDDDWLLNIAGIDQCRVPALQELWSEYVTAVLRPSTAAVHGCSPGMLCPSLHWDAMKSCAVRVRQVKPVESLCREYMESLGHLPLGGNCSLSQVVAAPGAEMLSQDGLSNLLEWASQSASPLARYHACEAGLSKAEELTKDQRDRLAAWFWEAVFPGGGFQKPNKGRARWALALQLAQYFVHYLEVRLPSDHGEAITAMAWWMATRLVSVIPDSMSRSQAFGDQLDQVFGRVASGIWDLVDPPMSPSMLRWLTVFGPSPWALAILSAVRSEGDARWLMAGPGPGTPEDRANVLVSIAIQVANLPLNEGPFQFSRVAGRALAWAAAAEPDEGKRTVMLAWAEGIDWSPSDSLAKVLESLDQSDMATQRWLCHSIRQRVALGALTGDDLWKTVSTDHWKGKTWLALDPVAMRALGCALIDEAHRRTPEWWADLPHLLAEVAEQRSATDLERQAMFGLLFKACCALNAPSAMSRLLRGRAGHRYRSLANAVRSNLEQTLHQGGTWAGGRLRGVLGDLQ